LRSRCGISGVAVDAEDSAIVHFFFGLFVSDRRAAEYHECRRPLISRRLLAEWRAGERPFFDAEQIARANAGSGLNFVAAYYGGRRDDPRSSIANYEGSRRAVRGWNLRTYTSEMCTDPQRDNREWGRSLGYRVLEYSPDDVRMAGIPEDWAPFIWAATRRDAEFNPGYATALLFMTYAPPRFAFTPREQHVLNLALDGATDCAIARAASISESAVKKHFRTLYEKVRAAGAFEPLVAGAPAAESTHGVELRRHLLTYLREHPEELRPYSPARRSRTPALHR
jgi:DNA-binding CsgD family transcriptional regulator